MRLHWLFIDDVCEAFISKGELKVDAFYHNHSLMANKVGSGFFSVTMAFPVNILNDLLDHKTHLQWLKLVTVVHTNSREPRLYHGDDQGSQEENVDGDFYDNPLESSSLEGLEVRPGTSHGKELK
jgi:hypothetical protein